MRDERKTTVIGTDGLWSRECQATQEGKSQDININLQALKVMSLSLLTPYMTAEDSHWVDQRGVKNLKLPKIKIK